jgi:hypothetical protein
LEGGDVCGVVFGIIFFGFSVTVSTVRLVKESSDVNTAGCGKATAVYCLYVTAAGST